MEQRFTFDSIAPVYGTARPGYPEELVDVIVSYADLKPNDRILEVGCGTGQATKSFANRGFFVLATDPGPEMLRGTRESLASYGNVEFRETPSKTSLQATPSSGSSLPHSPGTGCPRTCGSLRPRRYFRLMAR